MKKLVYLLTIALILLVGCGTLICNTRYNESASKIENTPKSESNNDTIDSEENENTSSAYLSITYTKADPNQKYGRMMEFYTYDLRSKKLLYVTEIPYTSSYAVGCVDKKNGKVYYSSEGTCINGNTSIVLDEYDVGSGKSKTVDDHGGCYNDIVLDGTELIVTTSVLNAISPAKYDLLSGKIEYLWPRDKITNWGSNDFTLTTRPVRINYNPYKGTFSVVYIDNDIIYDEDVSTGKKGFEYSIGVFDDSFRQGFGGKYTIRNWFDSEIQAISQLDSDLLILEKYCEDDTGDSEYEDRYYKMNYKTGICTRVRNPFPLMDSTDDFMTLDDGKSFFVKGREKKEGKEGLFVYDCEKESTESIILNDPVKDSHVVNFCCVAQ